MLLAVASRRRDGDDAREQEGARRIVAIEERSFFFFFERERESDFFLPLIAHHFSPLPTFLSLFQRPLSFSDSLPGNISRQSRQYRSTPSLSRRRRERESSLSSFFLLPLFFFFVSRMGAGASTGGGMGDKLLDQIFNLKFTSKQLAKQSVRAEKDEKAEKLKVGKKNEEFLFSSGERDY